MGRPLGRIVLGAMNATNVLEQITGHTTLICPSDREDVLLAALSAMYLSGRKDIALAGIVVTGGGRISDSTLKTIRRTTLPVLHVEPDAYAVLAEVHAANFKILPQDEEKIHRGMEIVRERIDVTQILEALH